MKEKKAIEIKLALLEDVKILRKAYEGIWDRPAQDVVVRAQRNDPPRFSRLVASADTASTHPYEFNGPEPCRILHALQIPYFLLVKKHGVYVA